MAVINTCKMLEKEGFKVTYLNVDKDGKVDINTLRKAINNDTILVSIMFANNEIGTIQDIEEIGKLCRFKGVIFHTDSVQAIGNISIDVEKMNIPVKMAIITKSNLLNQLPNLNILIS